MGRIRDLACEVALWMLGVVVVVTVSYAWTRTAPGHAQSVWLGTGIERVVSWVSFGHVVLYGEPFHSGSNGGFVAVWGAGHCAGVEWYGTPGVFTGCG